MPSMAAILRITAQTKGTQEVIALNDAVGNLGENAEKTGNKLQEASEKGERWKSVVGIAALTTGLIFATKSAVDFESGMADVRKVVDGLNTPSSLGSISQEILSLSQQLPITAEGFANIYAAAGQSGIAKDQLKDFSILVAKVATAFDFTADEAGTSLSQIKTALSLSTPELEKLADAMNHVENNTGATASGLVEFMRRSASVGKIAGLTSTQTLAFGAAMTQSGVDTEVAATSFNNMVKALSKGPSMTDRQTEALKRLGYSVVNAAQVEKQLVDEAEKASESRISTAKRESERIIQTAENLAEKRLAIARGENDDLFREIEKRFETERRLQQDGWEDQDIARERVDRERLENQIKALEREQRNQLRAEQERQKSLDIENETALDSIRDFYDQRINTIRQEFEDENRLLERSRRDQRKKIEEDQQAREQAEKKAARARLDTLEQNERKYLENTKEAQKQRIAAIEKAEAKALEKSKEQAKKTGETLATSYSQGFADRLQKDAIGTISKVLNRINELPKSQQISVLSDLFGDEARGLAPLLSNLDELKRILSLVAKEQEYLGSTSDEAAVRFTTSAARLQVFNNNMTALKIAVGDTLLPLLLGIIEPLKNIVAGFTFVTNAIKGTVSRIVEQTVLLSVFSKAIVAATGFVVSLGIAIGGVMSLATLTRWAGGIKLLAMIPGPLRLVAIALTAIGVSATPLGPIISAIGTALLAVQAIKFGASVIQGVSAMMPALTGLLAWVTGTFLPTMVGVFSGPVGWIALGVAAVIAGIVLFKEPIMGFLRWAGEEISNFWKNVFSFIYEIYFKKWEFLWTTDLLASITKAAASWMARVKSFFNDIVLFVNENWIKRWGQLWEMLTTDPNKFIENLSKAFEGLVSSIIENFKKLPGIFQQIFNPITESIGRGWRWLIDALRDRFNDLISVWNNIAKPVNDSSIAQGLRIRLPIIEPLRSVRDRPEEFARGGFVSSPTLGWIGEGRNPREYVIPEDEMDAAAAGWRAGLRGQALVQAWQSPGSTSPGSSAAPISINMDAPTVRIAISGGTTVMPDGREMVTIDQARAMVAQGTSQQAEVAVQAVLSLLQNPYVRQSVGI